MPITLDGARDRRGAAVKMENPEQYLASLPDTAPERAKNAGSVQLSPSSNNGPPVHFRQWQVAPNGIFRPAAMTSPSLPVAVYRTEIDQYGPYLQSQTVVTDDLLELPDSTNSTVLSAMRTFWRCRERYEKHGLLFKRGILLWGPPGGGKTATVTLLMQQLMKIGGVVVLCNNPELLRVLIGPIRQIEPDRALIVVLEDIDEIIQSHGEAQILSLLDGEAQTSNIVCLATTNYPDRLGARIVNRPSRFDERIYVGMPSAAARKAYLSRIAGEKFGLGDTTIDTWCAETDGFSIAHLRELVAAVLCLDQPYGTVLARLRSMAKRPQTVEGFSAEKVGFGISREAAR